MPNHIFTVCSANDFAVSVSSLAVSVVAGMALGSAVGLFGGFIVEGIGGMGVFSCGRSQLRIYRRKRYRENYKGAKTMSEIDNQKTTK